MYPKNRKVLDTEMEEIIRLLDLGVDFHVAKKELAQKTGQYINVQDLRNYRQKAKRKANIEQNDSTDEEANFNATIQKLVDQGVQVRVKLLEQETNNLECCILVSESQQQW